LIVFDNGPNFVPDVCPVVQFGVPALLDVDGCEKVFPDFVQVLGIEVFGRAAELLPAEKGCFEGDGFFPLNQLSHRPTCGLNFSFGKSEDAVFPTELVADFSHQP
jgi:hypothetical protein